MKDISLDIEYFGRTYKRAKICVWQVKNFLNRRRQRLLQTKTFAFKSQDMGMVYQAVNQRGSEAVIAQDSIPLAELQMLP